jgi:hypothetical protein
MKLRTNVICKNIIHAKKKEKKKEKQVKTEAEKLLFRVLHVQHRDLSELDIILLLFVRTSDFLKAIFTAKSAAF